MDSYRIEFAKSAEKDLRKIDRSMIPRLLAEIESLETNPRPDGVRKLVGSERTYRIRIGQYRVVYEIEDDRLILFVVPIAHRKDAYS